MKFSGSLDGLPLEWPRRKMNDISTTEYIEAKTLLKYKVCNFNIDRFGRYFLTSQIPSHSSNKRLIQEKVISLMRNQVTVKIISAQTTFASNLFLTTKRTEKEVLICDKSEKNSGVLYQYMYCKMKGSIS